MDGHRLMSGRLLTYTLALLLTCTTASAAVQTLDSIDDLKGVDFGVSVPKHSLLLLHWFANTIEMDDNHDVIDLDDNHDVIDLTFEPNRGDYGAHHYGNHERMLNQLPREYRYYTIGNLNPDLSSDLTLPLYVTRDNYNLMDYEETNRDRIIVRVREYDRTIDQVYITQHYGVDRDQGTSYDPSHTYRITNNLLREIRLFSTTTEGNQHSSLREIRDHFGSNVDHSQLRGLENMGGELAWVGLLLFIVITERRCPTKRRTPRSVARSADSVVHIPDDMQYEWPQARPQARQNVSSQESCDNCIGTVCCVSIIFGIVIVIAILIAVWATWV